ncbi:hypothetical protein RN001_005835 [Aquatica leii]|uniref:DDE Tnp4 domain-containing protein n=1 Tax=Aquatica leii TaxID=1421715 RepID=A0AAN7PKE6_9COLE|nr:hypothetical protein RN001_005835 [Aquatica leii]
MSLSTFMSVQERVVSYFIDILPAVIRYPRTDLEKLNTAALSGLPNVIGCVDGMYIQIRTPAHKIKSTYTNRNDISSVALQGICNAKKQFIDANEIPLLTNNGHYHLLGDSAYPIREWLLSPFRDYETLTQQQKRFNKTFSATRIKIENAFGLLKSWFRQLSRLEFHDVEKVARFILTCCVLHNIYIECDVFEEVINENGNNAPPDENNELRRSGEVKRQYICNLLNCG